MISYAAVDRIEGKFVVCELELCDLEDSKTVNSCEKETTMVDIPLERILLDIDEGDIIVVDHENGNIVKICYKDDVEKNRRVERIKEIMKK